MIELHVWGPAFGLPSIDVECLASIAYLHQLLQQDQWILVAGSDPTLSPTGDYPYLVDDDSIITGYGSIVDYLSSQNLSLDNDLLPIQKAHSTALKSHLQNAATPLLDAQLYTSSPDYLSTTRPAWTALLSHSNSNALARSQIPAQHHKIASLRTSSLGLSISSPEDLSSTSTSSTNTEGFTPLQQQEAKLISSAPSLLFKRRQTLHSALKAKQSAARFKLDSMVDALLEPLDWTLGEKKYLVRETAPSSIDCLTYAYISLLILPEMENKWIAESISERYPRVDAYVRRLHLEFFDDAEIGLRDLASASVVPGASAATAAAAAAAAIPTGDSDVNSNPQLQSRPRSLSQSQLQSQSQSQSRRQLPWRSSSQYSGINSSGTSARLVTTLLNSLFANIVSDVSDKLHIIAPSTTPLINNPRDISLTKWYDPSNLFLILAGPLVGVTGYLLHLKTHEDGERDKVFSVRKRSRMQSFGAVGDIFGALDF